MFKCMWTFINPADDLFPSLSQINTFHYLHDYKHSLGHERVEATDGIVTLGVQINPIGSGQVGHCCNRRCCKGVIGCGHLPSGDLHGKASVRLDLVEEDAERDCCRPVEHDHVVATN